MQITTAIALVLLHLIVFVNLQVCGVIVPDGSILPVLDRPIPESSSLRSKFHQAFESLFSKITSTTATEWPNWKNWRRDRLNSKTLSDLQLNVYVVSARHPLRVQIGDTVCLLIERLPMYKYSDPVRHNTLFHGYKASDKSVQIGVKVFHLTRVPSSLDGFKAEKKALQRLGRLLEFDEKHGLLVYRWIDGEPLDVLLARLSSPSTIQALYQVYTGLAQRLSQETGLLHKGIRPEFVIVTRDSLNMELVSFERSVEASLDPLKRQLEVRLEESRSVNEFSLTLKHIRARRLKSLSDPLRAVLPLTVTLGHGRQYRVQEYIRKTPRGIDYIARPVSSNSLRNNEREVFIRQFDRVSDTQGFLMEAEAMFHMGYVVSHFEDSVFVGVLPRGERLVNLIDDAPVEQVRVWTLEALSLVERTMAEYGLLHLSIGPECLFYDSSTKQLQLWEFWMSVRVLKGDPQWESKRAFAEGLVQQEFSPWLQEIRPVPEYKQEHLQGNKHRFLSASQDAALRNKLSYRVASLHRPLSETQTPITDS